MSTSAVLDQIRSRVLAGYPFLFLKTWEEQRWETELSLLAPEIERGLVVWSATQGTQPPAGTDHEHDCDPLGFLTSIASYPADHLFYVKDFHPYFDDPQVLRKLRDLAPVLAEQRKALLFVGPVNDVPLELLKDAYPIDLPLPGVEELRTELASVRSRHCEETGTSLEISAEDEERMLQAVVGLTATEARNALTLALMGRGEIDDDVFAMLVAEKRHMIEGSDLLEFFDLDEGLREIGGLDGLKDWITRRSTAFSERAREQGVPAPKGVLLLGVQGCGKSLTARATARVLSFPLVRLNVAKLLDAGRGSSEKNMNDVLVLMETIAPAVLWLDEIEKGFAGAGDESNRDVTMTRLMGQFLTWMSERQAPVFVVATANSVTNLPPEMLRRGRFDELFFIDLPNFHERKQIFEIHLAKRDWKPSHYNTDELAGATEGFSGAEIEQIVISAILDAFDRGSVLTQKDIHEAREQTVPLSVTVEEPIFELREWARGRCRQATSDSRVVQMLDEEHRRGETMLEGAPSPKGKWADLAQYGQLKAAIVEYVRSQDNVTFPQLQEDFAEYLETTGEQGLALRSDHNVVLWVGMSRELAEVLSKIIDAKRLYLHPAEEKAYESGQKLARLKLLPELPPTALKQPGWLPVFLRDRPPAAGSGRFGRVTRVKLSR
jgi:ATP-dependent 26S proteasome regulatory subunit